MKLTLSWLKDHLDTEADLTTILDTLTRIGLEVEDVEDPAVRFAGFSIARVLSAAPHPQADKLQILSVDAGDGVPLQVVCGAPNARAGLVGVFGQAGAVVPANGMELRVAAIRGVDSNGMMCSARELELGDDHAGIIELPDDAPVGTAFVRYAGLDDPVIDINVLPNRPDCMGVRGIARDLAAAGLGRLKPLGLKPVAATFPCPTEIRTDDRQGCPAFFGRALRGVDNRVSTPAWMKQRLEAIGQRSISALVDISNYLMFDLGRPSHAYDRAKLSGAVVARHATKGEKVVALKGVEYTLTDEMTVIADDVMVHDIAGIKGGEHSGCTEETTEVLLEIAYFDRERIARTGQALNLTSDARQRFERGVDPAFLDEGLEILTALIVAICGGEASEVVRAGTPPLAMPIISYDPGKCTTLGGVDLPGTAQRHALEALGFSVSHNWTVTPPTWRPDVEGQADIVEEVVRLVGLDAIASTPLPRVDGVARPTATPMQRLERKVRRAAAAHGLNEAITWSFISERQATGFMSVHCLTNPISEDLKLMRPSLIPGLLAAAQRNQHRGVASSRLFEIGRRYLDDGEHLTLGLVLSGEKAPKVWQSGKAQPFDAFDAKTEALTLLERAGVPIEKLLVAGEAGGHFHPGQSATLRLGPKTILASFGVLHPATAHAFDLEGTVV
ncbi:MAG: phenylalanine--tRNA ligase subunit beta, partial [Alphaproteobacteria bacterium]|nr:phenylalanine--tRNA ligase subunit beta [Alphaproteobacteria bacterium]